MQIAIHTVFILKENILFLEEWIYYHILLGFNKFYLYDNSKVTKSCWWNKKWEWFKEGKVNKYKVNFDKLIDITDTEINQIVQKLCEKYKCIEIIEWSPTDNKGNILYNQKQAHNHCLEILKKDNIDWCANIDMDEYIVMKDFDNIEKYILSLSPKIKNIRLDQRHFDTRFNNLDKLVTDITCRRMIFPKNYAGRNSFKNIYNVENTYLCEVHYVKIKGGREYRPPQTEIWFNHYKWTGKNSNNYKYENNINVNIKSKLKKDLLEL